MTTRRTIQNPDFPVELLIREDGAALSPPVSFDPFEIDRLVRRSNMSLLCQGTCVDTGEQVAIKICLPNADRTRFQREIKHTQSVRIAGVIKIHERDVGTTKDGCPFYATQWINGPNLGQFLSDKRRSLEEKVQAVEELARITAVLHEKDLSHRDLKPSNAMVEEGRWEAVKLLDLGQARSDGDRDLTRTGDLIRTEGYCPPYILSNQNDSRFIRTHEKRWDVYSLAVILIEALTGVRPAGDRDPNFTPAGVQELLKKKLPGDRRFDALLARCLASDPKDCPPTADDFYTELRACRGLRRRPSKATKYGYVAALLGLVVVVGGHEVFRRAAPERYDAVRTWLRGPAPTTASEPVVVPPDPRILSYSNAVVRLTVSPTGSEVHVVNHRANGLVVTNMTVPGSGQLDILLPDDPAAEYSLLVFKAGYHEYRQPLKPDSGPLEVRLEPLRGEAEFRSTAGAWIELRHSNGETRAAGPIPANGQLLVQSLDEGDWTWLIRRPDYETNSGKITGLVHGKKQVIDRPLKPLPGRLSVVGHPTMEIWEGANQLKPTNGWISLAAGAHLLELRRKGFRTQSLRVEMPPNRDISRVAESFVPEAGSLRVNIEVPPVATEWLAKTTKRLTLDGSPLTVTVFPHIEEDVGAGPRTVRLQVDGFSPEEQRVEVRDSQVAEVRLALQLLPAQLTVISDPAEAEVFRAGSRLGPTGSKLEVPAFERIELEVRAPGHDAARAVIAPLPPGATHRYEAKLTRQTGATLLSATKDNPWVNNLGMKFVFVPGAGVCFCIWETRVQDFEAFVKSTGHDATKGMYSLRKDGWKQRGDTWKSPGFPQSPAHPVVGVSYEDAVAFCRWLTEKERAEGRLPADWEYRLPTDAEWSAAVGNATYPWGNAWPPPKDAGKDAGNYAGEEAKDKDWPDSFAVIPNWRDSYPRTAPVGSCAPNQYGLYDLGGNVWERCSDWYRKDMNTAEVKKLWPVLDQDQIGSARVLRGASWYINHAADLASGCRADGVLPEFRYGLIGFRVVVGGLSR